MIDWELVTTIVAAVLIYKASFVVMSLLAVFLSSLIGGEKPLKIQRITKEDALEIREWVKEQQDENRREDS